eukprot:12139923-Alexandrium_andersonii.AAC.1
MRVAEPRGGALRRRVVALRPLRRQAPSWGSPLPNCHAVTVRASGTRQLGAGEGDSAGGFPPSLPPQELGGVPVSFGLGYASFRLGPGT